MAKNKTSVTDPLEASKIDAPPEPVAAPQPVVVAAPAPAPRLVQAAPAAPAPKVKRWRVAETTTISLSGQLIRLNKDDVVSESSYGPVGMQRIQESNVALVEME